MRTRSSDSSSNSDVPITASSSRVQENAIWTVEDEAKLLAFLTEKKGLMADNQMFKMPAYHDAAALLNESVVRGAPKTVNSVKAKWSRVCSFLLLRYII
jgi:hypothetical protein